MKFSVDDKAFAAVALHVATFAQDLFLLISIELALPVARRCLAIQSGPQYRELDGRSWRELADRIWLALLGGLPVAALAQELRALEYR